MEKSETDETAERQKRLQTLRSKQKEQPVKSAAGSMAGSGDDDTSDRKRDFIKNIMKKRMQEGGAGGQDNGAGKKGLLKRAMKKSGGAGDASGKDAGQFPRLKALLEQRGGQAGDVSTVNLVELEARVASLEQAMEKALEMFEKKTK